MLSKDTATYIIPRVAHAAKILESFVEWHDVKDDPDCRMLRYLLGKAAELAWDAVKEAEAVGKPVVVIRQGESLNQAMARAGLHPFQPDEVNPKPGC